MVMDTTRVAVGAAVHAPSVQNTQPWRFGQGDRDIDVYADAGRRLRVAGPDGRQMMIGRGAAVFTLRVALRYRGWLPRTRLSPTVRSPLWSPSRYRSCAISSASSWRRALTRR